MGMQVNTNVAANNAYRNLATTQNDLSKSLEKLSSGLRINRAADDAAGLAVSEGLKSQVGGLTVASRNAQDAVSVIQTAEGSLNEVQSILQRVRDLAVQAGNDSNNTESRAAITTEVAALQLELGRISESTNFNGTKLLKGGVDLSFQIGANGDTSSQIAVGLSGANVTTVTGELANGYTTTVAGAGKPGPVATTGFSFTPGTAKGSFVIKQTDSDGTDTGKSLTVNFGTTAVASQADITKAVNDANTAAGNIFGIAESGGVFTVTSKDTDLNSATEFVKVNEASVSLGG